jgi:hypothetical protein
MGAATGPAWGAREGDNKTRAGGERFLDMNLMLI